LSVAAWGWFFNFQSFFMLRKYVLTRLMNALVHIFLYFYLACLCLGLEARHQKFSPSLCVSGLTQSFSMITDFNIIVLLSHYRCESTINNSRKGIKEIRVKCYVSLNHIENPEEEKMICITSPILSHFRHQWCSKMVQPLMLWWSWSFNPTHQWFIWLQIHILVYIFLPLWCVPKIYSSASTNGTM